MASRRILKGLFILSVAYSVVVIIDNTSFFDSDRSSGIVQDAPTASNDSDQSTPKDEPSTNAAKQEPMHTEYIPPRAPQIASPSELVDGFEFELSCASMQRYFNGLHWNVPTRFSNFENQQIVYTIHARNSDPFTQSRGNNVTMLYPYARCGPGYMTEDSPQGTRVCRAELTYIGTFRSTNTGQPYGPPVWQSAPVASKPTYYAANCRWKQ